MTEKLVKYYKSKVITNALVYKYMKITYWSFVLSFLILIFSIALLVFSTTISFISSDFHLVIPLFIITVVLSLFTIVIALLVNKGAKKIIHKKYNIIIKKGWFWESHEYYEKKRSTLIDFLEKNSLHNEIKVQLIIDILDKELERRKLPSFIAPSIFISLVVPIWNQYLIFSYEDISTNNQAFAILISMIALVAMVVISFNFSKWFFYDLIDSISINQTTLRKNLIENLEDILIQIPNHEKK